MALCWGNFCDLFKTLVNNLLVKNLAIIQIKFRILTSEKKDNSSSSLIFDFLPKVQNSLLCSDTRLQKFMKFYIYIYTATQNKRIKTKI
jgi:hypothetical protein